MDTLRSIARPQRISRSRCGDHAARSALRSWYRFRQPELLQRQQVRLQPAVPVRLRFPAGYDTGIAIANTSQDNLGSAGASAAPQQFGGVQFWYYGIGNNGGTAPPTQCTNVASPGTCPTPAPASSTTWSARFRRSDPDLRAQQRRRLDRRRVRNGLDNRANGFSGYVIAQAQFQYCHAYAFITAVGAGPLSLGGFRRLPRIGPRQQVLECGTSNGGGLCRTNSPPRTWFTKTEQLFTTRGGASAPPLLYFWRPFAQPFDYSFAAVFPGTALKPMLNCLLSARVHPSNPRGISMLNRHVSLVVCLGVMAGATLAQTPPGTSYVVEFGNSGTTGQFQGFPSNTSTFGTPAFSATGPAGATQIIPKPDGSKYYVVGPNGVDDFGPAFGTPSVVNGIQGTLNPPNSTVSSCNSCPSAQAVISPNGSYLLIPSSVGSGAGSVYVLNTATDAVVMTQPISGSVVGIVVSRDSKTAWILGESSQTFITTINLSTLQQSGAPVILRDPVTNDSLGGGATAMTISPLGLLYVSATNAIVQIDPTKLSSTTPSFYLIPVSGTAGPLSISSDGTMAYFVNETPNVEGQSILSVSLAAIGTVPQYTTKSWPPFSAGQQLQQFDQILIANSASPMRIFAHTPGNTTLWDVAPDLSSVNVSTLNSVLPASSVLSIAVSDEIPAAQYLYALIGGSSQATIYRVVLSSNTVDSQASTLGPGTLEFAIIPPQSNATSITTFNGTQTSLTAGATAATLIGRVLDAIGRPMYNVPVTFSGDPSLIFTNVSAVSNEDGYVQATVTLGTSTEAACSYPVTLIAGSGSSAPSATFTLAIPGAGVGPTNPNGPNQMTIINGNGQLYQSQVGCFGCYLTVQELDTKGNPIVNDPVVFTVTGPNAAIGFVTSSAIMTDSNGMAQAQFSPQPLPYNVGFEGTTVTAVGTFGAVTFNETVYQLDPNNPGSNLSAYFAVPTSSPQLALAKATCYRVLSSLLSSITPSLHRRSRPRPGLSSVARQSPT